MGRKVAIVHDYVTQRGGAERVVLAMLDALPGSVLYTALYEPDRSYPEFANHDVRPLWTNKVGPLRGDHRLGVLLFPSVFAAANVDADLVVCSTSGFAHGVRTKGRKIVYCHNPPRWLYDQAPTYLAGRSGAVRRTLELAGPVLRAQDRRGAESADVYLANSTVVQERIRSVYGIDAQLLPPSHLDPFAVEDQVPVAGIDPGYILCVSRLLGYKNVEPLVQALALLPDQRLVIVGEGPEWAHIEAIAGDNVRLLGTVSDPELAWLYANSVGMASASLEDFGLVPPEAASYGKPAAVLRFGGFLDTVLEGRTGVFFDEPTPESIAGGIRELLAADWDQRFLRKHAEEFDYIRFRASLRAVVDW